MFNLTHFLILDRSTQR